MVNRRFLVLVATGWSSLVLAQTTTNYNTTSTSTNVNTNNNIQSGTASSTFVTSVGTEFGGACPDIQTSATSILVKG